MGYRHVMISSSVYVDVEKVAKDFYDKYKSFVNFSDNWTSTHECKMGRVWRPFIEDCHNNYELLDRYPGLPLQLVFFADEGDLQMGRLDIIHVSIDGRNDPIETQMCEPIKEKSNARTY